MAALRGRKSRSSLPEGSHNYAPHAHRTRPGQRLRVDPGAHHEDGAGSPDVDPARPQLTERIGGQLQPPTRRGARSERTTERRARGSDADLRTGPDLRTSPPRGAVSWSRDRP